MKTKHTTKLLSAIIICTTTLFVTVNVNAKIYKWTDANGVTHYSSQKPTQLKIKSEDIESKIRAAAGKYRPSTTTAQKTKPSSSNKTENKKEDKKTALAGPSAKLVAYCKGQRKNLAQLKKNYRNVWKDKDGKTSRLNQEQRQAKVDEIQKSITTECAGV